jgi:hypothetical protein
MRDALSRLIREYDLRNSPDERERERQGMVTRNVCTQCRSSGQTLSSRDRLLEDLPLFGETRRVKQSPLDPDTPCPNCGGKVVVITW